MVHIPILIHLINLLPLQDALYCYALDVPRDPKRASFANQESLFYVKEGKVTFSAWKSLPCRYSALSLHSKTVGRWPIPFPFSQSALSFDDVALARQSKQASSALTLRNARSAFALPSLCLRFRRRRKEGDRNKAKTTLPLKHPTKDRGF